MVVTQSLFQSCCSQSDKISKGVTFALWKSIGTGLEPNLSLNLWNCCTFSTFSTCSITQRDFSHFHTCVPVSLSVSLETLFCLTSYGGLITVKFLYRHELFLWHKQVKTITYDVKPLLMLHRFTPMTYGLWKLRTLFLASLVLLLHMAVVALKRSTGQL